MATDKFLAFTPQNSEGQYCRICGTTQLHSCMVLHKTRKPNKNLQKGGLVAWFRLIEIDIPGCREILEVRVAPSFSCATNGWIAENKPM